MKHLDFISTQTTQVAPEVENLLNTVCTNNPEDSDEDQKPATDDFDKKLEKFIRKMKERKQGSADKPQEEQPAEDEPEEEQPMEDEPEKLPAKGWMTDDDGAWRKPAVSFADMKSQLDDYMVDFNELAGHEELKETLRSIFRVACLNKARREKGLRPINHPPYHFIFSGNPGTGKTTVAKMMGTLFWRLDLLSEGNVLCHSRSSLVGEFIGQTEEKMEKVLGEAKGNVLFIDEAYSLFVVDSGKDFGHHALESLLTVTAAPDCNMVVILAGYKDEMEDLINSNPDIRSRFLFHVDFKDFSDKELSQIGRKLMAGNQLSLDEEAETALDKVTAQTMTGRDKRFGNGRWITNFIGNGVVQAMAKRILAKEGEVTYDDLTLVRATDIWAAAAADTELVRLRANVTRATGKRIGFQIA